MRRNICCDLFYYYFFFALSVAFVFNSAGDCYHLKIDMFMLGRCS